MKQKIFFYTKAKFFALSLVAYSGFTPLSLISMDTGTNFDLTVGEFWRPIKWTDLHSMFNSQFTQSSSSSSSSRTSERDTLYLKARNLRALELTAQKAQEQLYQAARNNLRQLAYHALDRGADITLPDENGDTPLDLALMYGGADITNYLIARGALTTLTRNPLHTVIKKQMSLAKQLGKDNLKKKQAHTFKILLEKLKNKLKSEQININALDKKGRTPLHRAVLQEAFQHIEVLLDYHADKDMLTSYEQTPLHEAVFSANSRIVELLISRGAQLNALNKWGDTPLARAVFLRAMALEDKKDCKNDNACVRALLKARASYLSQDNETTKACHAPLLIKAVEEQDLELVNLVLELGDSLNEETQELHEVLNCIYAENPLHQAIKLQTNSRTHNELTRIQRNTFSILLERLHKNGDNVDALNSRGQTALHQAVQVGSVEHAASLLHAGADVNARNQKGNTPLHEAVLNGHKALTNLLLSYSANTTLVDRDGQTPLSRALELRDQAGSEDSELRNIANSLIQALLAVRAPISNSSKTLGHGQILLNAINHLDKELIELVLDYGSWQEGEDDRCTGPAFSGFLHKALDMLIEHNAQICEQVGDLGLSQEAESSSSSSALATNTARLQATLRELGSVCESLHKQVTNLSEAIEGNNPKTQVILSIIELLIAHEARGNLVDSKDRTILDRAVKCPHLELVDLFSGAYPELVKYQNKIGKTSLHRAAKKQNEAIVKCLLHHGAQPEARNIFGVTAYRGTSPVIRKAIYNALEYNAQARQIKCPLCSPFDCDQKITSLHEAINTGDRDLVELILSQETWRNWDTNDKHSGFVHYALSKLILLNNRKDLNYKLQEAEELARQIYKLYEIIKLLLSYKAETSFDHLLQGSLLARAAQHGLLELVEIFLKLRPQDLNQPDFNGYTPLQKALRHGQTEVVKYLRKHGAQE